MQTTDPKINKSFKKLKRTEFMPFAPITLKNHAQKMYFNITKGSFSKFMTLTLNVKKMINFSPAAVHVDGTARPNLLTGTITLNYLKF